jgi:hypothetical protein
MPSVYYRTRKRQRNVKKRTECTKEDIAVEAESLEDEQQNPPKRRKGITSRHLITSLKAVTLINSPVGASK